MFDIFPNRFSGMSSRLKNTDQKKQIMQRRNGAQKTSFDFRNSIVNGVADSDWNGEIDSFIAELDQLQEQMLQNPSLRLVDEYRTKIGAFLRHILNHYQSHSYSRGIRKRIELKTWHSIDEELNILSQKMIAKNVEGFQLLKTLGTIKGLILDLKVGGK